MNKYINMLNGNKSKRGGNDNGISVIQPFHMIVSHKWDHQ